MQITQVRNATVIVEYASVRFLIDPMLSPKHALPPMGSRPDGGTRNPTVELAIDIDTIVDVDAVIVTHTHSDHWDAAASAALPKSIPMLTQHQKDASKIRNDGFLDVRLLEDTPDFGSVRLTKTSGQHGSDEAMRQIGERLGQVCGVIFRSSSEPTLYLAGDTVWNAYVAQSLASYSPDVVVLNCGDARITGFGSITMGAQDVLQVSQAAPYATLIATHMEAVNHATLSRAELRQFAKANGFASRLRVPEDGERIICN